MTEYEVVIGLETHIQLNTITKIFCSCKADSWDDPPNTNICPVCTGLPGVLPVLNQAVVEKGVLLAAAMHADMQPALLLRPQELLLPRPAQGLPDLAVRPSLAHGGYLDLPMPAGLRAPGRHPQAAHRRRCRQDQERERAAPDRFQPLRRAADRDGHRPRPALRR